ncbi:protein fantom isoform X3 [Nerophis ophidion]|uniref:protein fantom isoform X3 n=1 Tax=Nerophis ophidion TaxID=159077 RepID=UPI002AE000CE|nr:protein fantom isoform X3 [Nerophis ophidion]XP_061768484.1 protein fantom isoform X3 [Nerophis ophidion]
MSPVVDETAGDLPVRDVGLMRGGLMLTVPDATRDMKPWKKHHIMMTKDPQRLFRFPREQLEDLCLHLQEENTVLRMHSRAQEQKMRRMSTRLIRLRQASPGAKDRDMEDSLQELEARVATLESQKVVLQNKLSLAKQHILDLGGRTPYKFNKGKCAEVEGGVRRAAQTAPPRYGPTKEDTRGQMEKFCVSEQMRVTELQLALRDTLQDKEREMKKQQAEIHKATIRENVDVIRLQKNLSEKSTALRVTQEKITDLQQAYEKQLEETQTSLRESQAVLLEKVEELSEKLKQERQRVLTLDGQLTTASLSLQNLEKLQERISDLEGERDRIKESYDSLLESTLSTYNDTVEEHKVVYKEREAPEDTVSMIDANILEKALQAERDERGRLESEKEKLILEKEIMEEQREQEGAKLKYLEEKILEYNEQISVLQRRLNSVTKEFDMSDEELSETLFQIKAFRMQQESREGLCLPGADGEKELVNNQAVHAETVLELQKTRSLLLLEHRISKDFQEELDTTKTRLESEREAMRMRMAEKDKLLCKRALQINALQDQLKTFAYNTKNHKRTIPIQYTWPTGEKQAVSLEDYISYSPLRSGESLLEIHIKDATFTPSGLRNMSSIDPDQGEDTVTFCTYSLLNFEVHSTPLVAGSQPNYSFTSHYALTACDLERLEVQGWKVKVELHQAVGGVRFLTHGSGQLSLLAAVERRGEHINGRVHITGSVGEIVGVVDFWVRLFPPTEPINAVVSGGNDRTTATKKMPAQISLGWQTTGHAQELYDFGGGIPNELMLLLERCESLKGRWPGLLPDAYLTYRFYDLQPHVSQTVRSNVNPVFHDITSYPLAITTDVLHYLRSSSLWVYVFDDSDDQIPPVYLAKTPIPLRALATGREIQGHYVLRDPAGGPRGTVRVLIKWKYPFQPPVDVMENSMKNQGLAEDSQKPIAKPRVKTKQLESGATQAKMREMRAYPSLDNIQPRQTKRSNKKSPARHDEEPRTVLSHSPITKSSRHATSLRRRSFGDPATQNISSVDLVSVDKEQENEERSESAAEEPSESSETLTSDLIVSSKQERRKGDKLRVEIFSLTFEPSSQVALDDSVQRVYVEYRLLGIPMETTETPVSLRKPTEGEEIHYNFTRVIYVDGSLSAPLRQYLYTMLEGSDPNKGRLKFTVVSEPMDDNEECWDVGCSFLDLQELLLTGNDVIERQIDIVRVDDEKEVIGFLKVSLEAAKALTGIYQEFHRPMDAEDNSDKETQQEEEEQQQMEKDAVIVIDYNDSDF